MLFKQLNKLMKPVSKGISQSTWQLTNIENRRAVPEVINGVKYRMATIHDFKGVMDINRNIYNGLDYLQSTYKESFGNSKKYLGVATVENDIVAFTMHSVVDDWNSFIRQASRVKMGFQGQGLIPNLGYYIQKNIMENHPMLNQFYDTVDNWDEVKSRLSTKKQEYKPKMKRSVVSFDANPFEFHQSIRNIIKAEKPIGYELNKIQMPVMPEIASMLEECEKGRLFPTGFILANWSPYRIQYTSNYKLILEDTKTVFVTTDEKGRLLSISFGTHIDTPSAMRYTTDYYGTSEQDAIYHIMKHVILISQMDQERDISFSVLLPETLDKLTIKDFVVTKMGLTNQGTGENSVLILKWPLLQPREECWKPELQLDIL
ncbi:unnamed protein product [Owenia fusiformis]|uniref:Histidine N-acetyltransferase C-terminal domain-containing protein n=1 Tax=Owenia fusiformis TaxID=6347 RepID=A0A8J1TD63_OWEFU|nr:unnamed protein product [Owenia fusiformis]